MMTKHEATKAHHGGIAGNHTRETDVRDHSPRHPRGQSGVGYGDVGSGG